jgi:hypothetical protein
MHRGCLQQCLTYLTAVKDTWFYSLSNTRPTPICLLKPIKSTVSVSVDNNFKISPNQINTLFIMFYFSILLHCIGLTLRFACMPSICNVGYYSLVVFLCCHYMFRPNRSSSGVQVVVVKDSADHCKAGLFLLYGYLKMTG